MKIRTLLLSLLAVFLLTASALAAPAEKPVLANAEIEITAQSADTFTVRQVLSLDNVQAIKEQTVENVLSKPDGASVSDFVITVGGEKINYTAAEQTYLNKIKFSLPSASAQNLTYEANFTVKLDQGVFTIPLLVPLHPTTGSSEAVKFKYTAPAGTYIHETSFPIISNLPDGNEYSTLMANIPSHIQYVYGPQPSPFFNTYNIISGVVLVILIGLIIWGFNAEQSKAPAKKAHKGGAA